MTRPEARTGNESLSPIGLEFSADIEDELIAETVNHFRDAAEVTAERLPESRNLTGHEIEIFLGIVVYGADAVRLIAGAVAKVRRRFKRSTVRIEAKDGTIQYELPANIHWLAPALEAIPADAEDVHVRFASRKWNADNSCWEESGEVSFRRGSS